MSKYICRNCGIKTEVLRCNECDKPFHHNFLKRPDGTIIHIIECEDGCQKLKSPICCAQDMDTV